MPSLSACPIDGLCCFMSRQHFDFRISFSMKTRTRTRAQNRRSRLMCVDFYVPHVTFDGKPERHSAASRKGGGDPRQPAACKVPRKKSELAETRKINIRSEWQWQWQRHGGVGVQWSAALAGDCLGLLLWMQHATRRCFGNALTGECLPIRVHVQLGPGITCVPE